MLVNMLGFNFIWFGLIYWGNVFTPIALCLIALHLIKLSSVNRESRLVLLITAIGGSIDSLLHFFGFFIFPDSAFTPLWLIVLWAAFACTVCHGLNFLSHSKILQMVIGGGFAPLSYFAAERLGAVNITVPLIYSYLILTLIWAILFVLFFTLKPILINKRLKHVETYS